MYNVHMLLLNWLMKFDKILYKGEKSYVGVLEKGKIMETIEREIIQHKDLTFLPVVVLGELIYSSSILFYM